MIRTCCQQDFLDGFTPEEHQQRCTHTAADEHRAANPWRVSVAQLVRKDWPTQKEALDHADQLQTAGHWVTVLYWSDDRWQHYATFRPAESVADVLTQAENPHTEEGGPQS